VLRRSCVGVLAVIAGQACMPAIMHSPRIDGGLTTGLAASYTAGPRRTRGDMGRIVYAHGPVGLNLGYGWTSERSEGFGARLGIHVPVPLVLAAQPDLYVQLPRRAVLGLDGGLGIVSVPVQTTVMPYAQLGALDASGSGFYATYGFLIGPDPSDANYSGRYGGADVPGIAFQRVNGRTTTRLFVMAIIARDRQCPDGISDCVRRDNWAVASGMAMEFRHRKHR
jgi:hypothetical protein